MPLDRFSRKDSSPFVASKQPYISSPIEIRDHESEPSPPNTYLNKDTSSDFSREKTTSRSPLPSYDSRQGPHIPEVVSLRNQNNRHRSSVYSKEDLETFKLEEIPIDPQASEPTFPHIGTRTPEATTPSIGVAESKTKSKPITRVAAILYVIGVAVLVGAVALGATAILRADNVEKQLQSLTASDTPNATPDMPPIPTLTLTRATDDDSRSNVDATSVILVTSVLETSETPPPARTTTSTLESSSVLSSSSSASSSSHILDFMQSTMMGDTIVRRSGYVNQLGVDDLYLDRREDPENCEDTTITSTTTLTTTTTITSTIRTFTPVASSIGSNSASPQLSEPKPAETIPECITNTIFHTDGIPTSTASSDDTATFDTESPSVTADSTPSPDMTPSPTTSSVAQSLGENTTVVSASSIAQARRVAAPLTWTIPRRLRRFLPLVPGSDGQTQQNRNLLPSLTAMPTATTTQDNGGNNDGKQLLSTASSNAAACRQGKRWMTMSKSTSVSPSKTLERRQASSLSPSPLASGVKWTPWYAYSQVQRQLAQMCYSVETHLNTTLVPANDQTPEDLKMGKTLNDSVCNSLAQDFPQITEGEKCDRMGVWESLVKKVEELCVIKKEGKKLVQDVELLCKTTESIKEDVDACGEEGEGEGGRRRRREKEKEGEGEGGRRRRREKEKEGEGEGGRRRRREKEKEGEGEGGGISGTGTMSAASLVGTFDGGPSTAMEESAAGADVKSTTESGQVDSISPSISLQQNAVENASPSPAGSSASPVTLANEPPPITSIASLLTTSILPTPPISGNTPVSAPPTPASGLGVLPPHPSYEPPADWTISMLTYSKQAANYSNRRTMPSNAVGTPPVYTGSHLSRDWEEGYPFPIPTGYVAPNIVPADPNVGQLTNFNPGLGACGPPEMVPNELAVAISWELYDMGRLIGGSILERGWKSLGVNPDGTLSTWPRDKSSSALCNQGIRLWLADDEGNILVEQKVVVRDRCTACNVSDLDIQPDVYSKYWDGLKKGRIQVTWEWMQAAPTDVPG